MIASQIWVSISAIVAFTFCVSLYLVFHFKDKRYKQETLRQAVQLSESSDSEALAVWTLAQADIQTDLSRALSDIGLGLGFAAAGGVLHFNFNTADAAIWALAFGLIIFFQGAGRLLAYYLRKKSPQ